MDQEIASVINRALFHQKAPAQVQIMNTKRNATGTMMAVTHKSAMAAITLIYRNTITIDACLGKPQTANLFNDDDSN